MPISAHETIATTSNSNFVGNFLAYFENQIEDNQEPEKSLSETPNYFAWLGIVSEYITYLIRAMIYINHEDSDAFDYPYKKLLDTLLSNKKLSEEQKEYLILFAEIRHIMVHKGFPNPHKKPSNNERLITKGYTLKAERVSEIADLISKPKSYTELRKKSDASIKAILSVTNELNHDFGWIQIKDRKC